jgi:drug/metabolite transporter (DMT)-like permease
MPVRPRLTILDAFLLLMATIWGTNYPIIKSAFRELPPQAFNALRMSIAAATFLLVMAAVRVRVRRRNGEHRHSPGLLASTLHTPARLTPRDWLALAGLGIVGHFLYQYLFISGLARTSVANSSLIIAATPVLIALISAAIGEERVGLVHWIGAAVSAVGIYLVVGQGMHLGPGLVGDLMVAGAVVCWAVYTLGSRPLMDRHSPVAVTGLSMALGAALYVPVAWPTVRAVDWTSVSPTTFALLLYSALFGLCLAYTIWYVSVRQIGSARTSVYSNLVPLVAMGSAAIFLREPIGWRKGIGAIAVLAGVALTRVGAGPRQPAPERGSSPYAGPGSR